MLVFYAHNRAHNAATSPTWLLLETMPKNADNGYDVRGPVYGKTGETAEQASNFKVATNPQALKTLLSDPRLKPNIKDKKGHTALFLAASDQMEIVKILLTDKRVKVGPKEKTQIALLKASGGRMGAG